MQTHTVVCKTMCNLIRSISHSLALQPPAQSMPPGLTQLSGRCSLLGRSGPLVPSADAASRSLLCSQAWGGWQEAGADGRRSQSTWYRFHLFLPKWTPCAQRLGQRN